MKRRGFSWVDVMELMLYLDNFFFVLIFRILIQSKLIWNPKDFHLKWNPKVFRPSHPNTNISNIERVAVIDILLSVILLWCSLFLLVGEEITHLRNFMAGKEGFGENLCKSVWILNFFCLEESNLTFDFRLVQLTREHCCIQVLYVYLSRV